MEREKRIVAVENRLTGMELGEEDREGRSPKGEND